MAAVPGLAPAAGEIVSVAAGRPSVLAADRAASLTHFLEKGVMGL